VFGVEGQGNWADFSGDNVSNLFPGDRNRTRIDSFGLITGQVGYAWNNVLAYVKGGAAVVGDKFDIHSTATGALLGSTDQTRWGGTVGAGLEVGFAPNWSVGVEYNHIFLQDKDVAFTGLVGTDRISQDVDMGLVRLNYRFGGPIIAKY
jgi:outer membrane immunogenic protein